MGLGSSGTKLRWLSEVLENSLPMEDLLLEEMRWRSTVDDDAVINGHPGSYSNSSE